MWKGLSEEIAPGTGCCMSSEAATAITLIFHSRLGPLNQHTLGMCYRYGSKKACSGSITALGAIGHLIYDIAPGDEVDDDDDLWALHVKP